MLLQNKYIVHLLMLFGVIALLSVVTVSSYTIAVGDMAYQKLYLGRVTIVFVICSLISCLLYTSDAYMRLQVLSTIRGLIPDT